MWFPLRRFRSDCAEAALAHLPNKNRTAAACRISRDFDLNKAPPRNFSQRMLLPLSRVSIKRFVRFQSAICLADWFERRGRRDPRRGGAANPPTTKNFNWKLNIVVFLPCTSGPLTVPPSHGPSSHNLPSLGVLDAGTIGEADELLSLRYKR